MQDITHIDQLDFSKSYTYADYLQWKFDERVELIKGFLHRMSPAPNRKHQKLAWNFTHAMSGFLVDKKCEAYAAPFDVRFF